MSSGIKNIKRFPQAITANQELIEDALALGCVRAKLIQTKNVTLARWVKMQCQFGCSEFANCFTCPPSSPTLEEMSDLLLDYERALILQAGEASRVQEIVVNLESKFREKGFYKAFALGALPCNLCEECTVDSQCKFPQLARPTMQACGIDIPMTIGSAGWEHGRFSEPCSENQPFGLILLH